MKHTKTKQNSRQLNELNNNNNGNYNNNTKCV